MSGLLDARRYETLLLGMLLHHPGTIHEIADSLSPDHFGTKDTQVGYEVARRLAARGELDFVAFSKGCNGNWPPEKVAELSSGYEKAGPVQVTRLAAAIRDAATCRASAAVGKRLQACRDPHEIRELYVSLGNSLDAGYQKPFVKLWEPGNYLKRLEGGERREIINTGFCRIDDLTGGMSPGHLCVVGANSGVGKTTLTIDMAIALSSLMPTAYQSAEVGQQGFEDKYYAMLSGVQQDKLRKNLLSDRDWQDMVHAMQRATEHRLVVDCYTHEIEDMMLRLRRMVAEFGVRVVFIDHLQRIQSVGETEEQRIAYAVRSLKRLAVETNCLVVLISQFNREVKGEEPQIWHLKGSSAIEQESDFILLFWRKSDAEEPLQGKLAKNRISGREGYFTLQFDVRHETYRIPPQWYPPEMPPLPSGATGSVTPPPVGELGSRGPIQSEEGRPLPPTDPAHAAIVAGDEWEDV